MREPIEYDDRAKDLGCFLHPFILLMCLLAVFLEVVGITPAPRSDDVA